MKRNYQDKMKIQYITAFFDIGRSDWMKYTRSSNNYVQSAIKFLNRNYPMIMFVDDRYISILEEFYDKSIYKNKILIPINEEWLKTNIYFWKQLEKDEEIISSDKYKNLVFQRIQNGNPENIYSRYNIINHSKIDFINYTINHYDTDDFLYWVDFGYFYSILGNNPSTFPTRELDINRFNVNKMNFFLRSGILPNDFDMIQTLKYPRETFTGSLFAGPKSLMYIFQQRCHEVLKEFHENNISDDDQHLYLRVYYRYPEIFHLVIEKDKWPQILYDFQLV